MKHLISDTLAHWKKHNATRMGAALSYYAMLSFVPFLVLIIFLTTSLFDKTLIESTITHYFTLVLGKSSALDIEALTRNTSAGSGGFFTAIVSIITIVIGALGVFSELDNDLDELWQLPAKTHQKALSFGKKVLIIVKQKLASFSLIPVIAIGLIVSATAAFLLGIVQSVNAFGLIGTATISMLQLLVPFFIGTALITLLYRILPNITLPWNALIKGALVTAGLFVIGNIFIGLYLKLMLNTATYGAAGSLVGLLVWIYYSAQVFFLGASFTFVHAKQRNLIPSRD